MSCFTEGKIQRDTCLPPGSPGHPCCLQALQERTAGTGVLVRCLRGGGASSWRRVRTEAIRGSQPPPEPHSTGRGSQLDPHCRVSSAFGKQSILVSFCNFTLMQTKAPNHIGASPGLSGSILFANAVRHRCATRPWQRLSAKSRGKGR